MHCVLYVDLLIFLAPTSCTMKVSHKQTYATKRQTMQQSNICKYQTIKQTLCCATHGAGLNPCETFTCQNVPMSAEVLVERLNYLFFGSEHSSCLPDVRATYLSTYKGRHWKSEIWELWECKSQWTAAPQLTKSLPIIGGKVKWIVWQSLFAKASPPSPKLRQMLRL